MEEDIKKLRSLILFFSIVLLIGTILIVFVGTAAVNDKLEKQYDNNIEEYERTISCYEKAYSEYVYNSHAATNYNGYGTIPVIVSADSKFIGGERVGNEMHYLYKVDNIEVDYALKINISNRKPVELYTYIWDDEDYPDRGSSLDEVRLDIPNLVYGFPFSHTTRLYENRGKFSGHTAFYETTYKFELDPDFLEKVVISKEDYSVKPIISLIKPKELIGQNMIATISIIALFVICSSLIAYFSSKKRILENTERLEKIKENIRSNGYDLGYKDGQAAGYEKGQKKGFDDGRRDGYRTGNSEGFNDGYREGYAYAFSICKISKGKVVLPELPSHYCLSKYSKKFHRPDCRFASPLDRKVETRYEAEKAGFTACKVCKP